MVCTRPALRSRFVCLNGSRRKKLRNKKPPAVLTPLPRARPDQLNPDMKKEDRDHAKPTTKTAQIGSPKKRLSRRAGERKTTFAPPINGLKLCSRWGNADDFESGRFLDDIWSLHEVEHSGLITELVRDLEGNLFFVFHVERAGKSNVYVYESAYDAACRWLATEMRGLTVTPENFLQFHGIQCPGTEPQTTAELQQICLAEYLTRAANLPWLDAISTLMGLSALVQNNTAVAEVRNLCSFVKHVYSLNEKLGGYNTQAILKNPEQPGISSVDAWLAGWFYCLIELPFAEAIKAIELFSRNAEDYESVGDIVSTCKLCMKDYVQLQGLINHVNAL